MQTASRVAIIMRSKDEQPYASLALKALSKQNFKNFTLYNVDSGSSDGTLEAIKSFNPHPENVVEITPKDYIPGRVLNMMIARTTEPIIVFLNADAIAMDEFWLERLLAPLMENKADATFSRQVTRPNARFIDKYDYDRAYSPRNTRNCPDFFSAVACAFRRELWERTKFYEHGYSEDLAWSRECQKQGARFMLVIDSVVEHSHNFSISGLYRKRYRHGIAFVYIYGSQPQLVRQLLLCVKEMVRDTLYALRQFRPDTIPYNLLYRFVIHYAYYRGESEGQRCFSGLRNGFERLCVE